MKFLITTQWGYPSIWRKIVAGIMQIPLSPATTTAFWKLVKRALMDQPENVLEYLLRIPLARPLIRAIVSQILTEQIPRKFPSVFFAGVLDVALKHGIPVPDQTITQALDAALERRDWYGWYGLLEILETCYSHARAVPNTHHYVEQGFQGMREDFERGTLVIASYISLLKSLLKFCFKHNHPVQDESDRFHNAMRSAQEKDLWVAYADLWDMALRYGRPRIIHLNIQDGLSGAKAKEAWGGVVRILEVAIRHRDKLPLPNLVRDVEEALVNLLEPSPQDSPLHNYQDLLGAAFNVDVTPESIRRALQIATQKKRWSYYLAILSQALESGRLKPPDLTPESGRLKEALRECEKDKDIGEYAHLLEFCFKYQIPLDDERDTIQRGVDMGIASKRSLGLYSILQHCLEYKRPGTLDWIRWALDSVEHDNDWFAFPALLGLYMKAGGLDVPQRLAEGLRKAYSDPKQEGVFRLRAFAMRTHLPLPTEYGSFADYLASLSKSSPDDHAVLVRLALKHGARVSEDDIQQALQQASTSSDLSRALMEQLIPHIADPWNALLAELPEKVLADLLETSDVRWSVKWKAALSVLEVEPDKREIYYFLRRV